MWDLITNCLVDVMKCKMYCTSLCFAPSGEYLATCHHEQRSIYLWANKSLFAPLNGLKALPLDYVPEDSLDLPLCRCAFTLSFHIFCLWTLSISRDYDWSNLRPLSYHSCTPLWP